MKILVTGASGFIGRSLVRTLCQKNLDAKGLSRRSNPTNPDSIQCDLNQFQSIDSVMNRFRPETIVHSAGSLLKDRSGSFDSISYQNNINSTAHLLAAASKHQVKRFIFLSSNTVYGSGYSVQRDTNLIPNPQNWYSKSKWIGEQMVFDHRATGMETISLRLPIVIGPGKKEGDLVTEMIQAIRKTGVIQVYGKGQANRPLLDVQDACNIIYHLTQTQLESRFVAISASHPKPKTIHQIAECVQSYFGTGSEAGKIQLNPDRPESPNQTIDPEILQELIPYSFHITPEDTIFRTLDGERGPI